MTKLPIGIQDFRALMGVLHKSDLRIVPGFGPGVAADVRRILWRVEAHVCRRIQGRMPVQGVQSVFMQHTRAHRGRLRLY